MGISPDSKIHGANMGPSWVLSAPDGPHVSPMNPTIRVHTRKDGPYIDMVPRSPYSFDHGFVMTVVGHTMMIHGTQIILHGHGDEGPWWRHQMDTFSALLAFCAVNSPVTGKFPAQRPVTRSFDVYFDLRPNKWLSKQCRRWWFETPSRPLWRCCNDPV